MYFKQLENMLNNSGVYLRPSHLDDDIYYVKEGKFDYLGSLVVEIAKRDGDSGVFLITKNGKRHYSNHLNMDFFDWYFRCETCDKLFKECKVYLNERKSSVHRKYYYCKKCLKR